MVAGRNMGVAMVHGDDHALVRQAIDHLERALAVLDALGLHAAAAQLDHVIDTVQGRSESDLGR